MNTNKKCTVEAGRFVKPCKALDDNVANRTPGFSRVKGIAHWTLTNTKTFQPARAYFGVKSKNHPNGFLFNFCPFCGTDISAPFMKEGETA